MAKKVTIQYFRGCPNQALAERRVGEAMGRLGGARPVLELQEIPDAAEAERVGFRGSPTVLIDGVDPFTDPAAPAGFACRVYRTPAGAEGAPSVDELAEALS